MYTQRLDLSDVGWKRRPFDGVVAYAQTKRAEVILTELWAERLAAAGVDVHSMHPGWADTPGVQSSLPRFWRFTRNRLRTSREGADTIAACFVEPIAGSIGILVPPRGYLERLREICDRHGILLVFEGEIDGQTLEGIDLIDLDSDGKLKTLKVMVRPFRVYTKFAFTMAERLGIKSLKMSLLKFLLR